MKTHSDSRAPRFAFLSPEPLVTQEEIRRAQTLEDQIDWLESEVDELGEQALIDRFKNARNRFLSNACPETLEAFKSAARDHFYFRKDHIVRQMLSATIEDFYAKQIRPFATPILERAVAIAKGRLGEVRKSESERIQKLTGAPITRSDVVEAAARPVRELEGLLKTGFDMLGQGKRLTVGPKSIVALFVPVSDWVN